MSKKKDPLYWLFGGFGHQPLSAAGKLFKHLDKAEKKLAKNGVSDEVLAAIRRIQITSAREQSE